MSILIRKLDRLVRMLGAWLSSSDLSMRMRLSYFYYLLISIIRDRLTGKKFVRYLDGLFYFDSPITPFLLLQYPAEIRNRIGGNVDAPIRTVLDIGGNIGQFSTTVAALNSAVERIDIFEPNPNVFTLLEKNIERFPKAKCFNLGIGPKGAVSFHFTPGYSSIGSVIPENARYRPTNDLAEVEVELISDIALVTGTNEYDLVKIDVEGFEYEVIESMDNLIFRYLYIEITGPAKQKSHPTSEVYALLRDKFGPFEVCYNSPSDRNSTVFETLLEFV